MSDLSLTHYGDLELWVATGVIPEGRWSLPLHVRRYRGPNDAHYVRASPIQPITVPQSEQLKRHLNPQNLWDRQDSFVCPKDWFEHRAHRAEGITPDYYRVWPGENNQLPLNKDHLLSAAQELPESDDSFLAHVSRKRGLKLSLLKLAWLAISLEAPKWLIGQKKPLHLGFVTLHAFPLRANWKSILLAKAPWVVPLFHKPREEWDLELTKAEFLPLLCKEENMALNSHEQLEWCVEAVVSPEFRQETQRLEEAALLHGQSGYVARYEKLILHFKSALLDTYAAFLAAISLPTGTLLPGLRPGSRRLAPLSVRGKRFLSQLTARPVALPAPSHDLCVVVDTAELALGPACIQADLPAPDAGLSALPPLLPPVDELWGRQQLRELSQPTDEPI